MPTAPELLDPFVWKPSRCPVPLVRLVGSAGKVAQSAGLNKLIPRAGLLSSVHSLRSTVVRGAAEGPAGCDPVTRRRHRRVAWSILTRRAAKRLTLGQRQAKVGGEGCPDPKQLLADVAAFFRDLRAGLPRATEPQLAVLPSPHPTRPDSRNPPANRPPVMP